MFMKFPFFPVLSKRGRQLSFDWTLIKKALLITISLDLQVSIKSQENMEQPGTSSNSSSFEDLAKDNDVKDIETDDDFMDILGNKQLTKKVGHLLLFCNIAL